MAGALAAPAGRPDDEVSRARAVIATGAETYGYAGAYVLTPAGPALLAAGGQAEALGSGASPTVAAATAGAGPAMGSSFRGDDGRVYVDTAAAVRDTLGRPLGVVVLRTDAQQLLFPHAADLADPEPHRRNHAGAARGRRSGVSQRAAPSPGQRAHHSAAISRTETPAVKAVLGGVGPSEGTDYRDVAVLMRRWTYDEQTFAVAVANLVAMPLTGREGGPRAVRELPIRS